MNKKHGSSKITVLEGIDRYELSMLLFVELNKNLEIFNNLFREINTYYVDQTDVESLNELSKKIPSDLDLVIDDGLHSPCANINTLFFGIKKINILRI